MSNLVKSSDFAYFTDTKVFVTEVSDHFKCDAQYYNNVAAKFMQRQTSKTNSVGFKMESAKTGKVVTFIFTHADRNSEGEIHGWNFECQEFPGLKALVIND